MVESEISMILDASSYDLFQRYDGGIQENKLSKKPNEIWRALEALGYFVFHHIFRKDGGDFDVSEVGVVHAMAEPLTKAKINLFYFSTFRTGYVLVLEQNLQESVNHLKKNFSLIV